MNYTELVNASQSYADRNDIEVQGSMDIFIVMAEARMNRLLKTRLQSTRIFTPTVEDAEYYSLPPDYAGMRNIQLNSALPSEEHCTTPFTMLSPQLFDVQRGRPYSGTLYYSIIGDQIQIFPKQAAGNSLELVYYQKVPPLTEAAPENWMSVNHPDIYLAGMTGEVSLFAKDYDTASSWFQRGADAIDELDVSDEEERWSGAPLQIRIG